MGHCSNLSLGESLDILAYKGIKDFSSKGIGHGSIYSAQLPQVVCPENLFMSETISLLPYPLLLHLPILSPPHPAPDSPTLPQTFHTAFLKQ